MTRRKGHIAIGLPCFGCIVLGRGKREGAVVSRISREARKTTSESSIAEYITKSFDSWYLIGRDDLMFGRKNPTMLPSHSGTIAVPEGLFQLLRYKKSRLLILI